MKNFLLVTLFFISFQVFSEELEVIKAVYTPKDFYVGDLVTLHLHVETPFNGDIVSPLEIPTGEWVEIKSINLVSSGPEESIIRISFTSFAPGLRVIPNIVFGEHILKEFKIQTLSILDDQFSSLQPLSPQMLPPGTSLLVVFVLVGLVFGPYILFLIIKTLYLSIKIAIKKYKREKPFRAYYKILKQLKGSIKESSVRSFYVVITEQLRVYLSVRFHKDFYSATTKEMSYLLRTIMEEDSTEELLSICRFADLVKFSHTNASTLHREKDLKTIIEIVHQLEGKEKSHARF
ncbi:hypothetical protein EW093_09905 [Thiospirochaeta perfilievii]|uniref:Protein BatD n=1 Tax=Thiospirochaeta perfilievii TaxID=252967 RepID=A0A5C1QDF3_9SPIO|nr:hypothetical protein [Thiospirochaeta perfilievii]QEN05009.1 hypothetical protein EW093_09905 [Thiospirochaeta perfilievii]